MVSPSSLTEKRRSSTTWHPTTNLSLEKRKENQPKKRKSQQAKEDPSEDGRTYGIDRLNIGKAENELESGSE